MLFLNPTFEPNVFSSQFCDVAKSEDLAKFGYK
jgi:hypothetical protein